MMTLRDILAGESKNIEFKEALPERSIKYMKSVVAFANSSGGRILFGIEDGTCRVVGIDDEYVFQTMDAITNAIVDSCEPAIYPDISLQTIEGKTIIVVEIPAGRQRPYFIKSQGLESGVYVRVSGTSRPADPYQIKELLFEGNNRCFDQTLCLGLEVTADDIQQLCRSMKETALKNCLTDEEKRAVKDVTIRQLLSWGILQERDGKYAATNAFALLTGNDILPTAIQCGVFRGITKAVFLDRREYTGPIQDQAEEALQFVLRNIRLGAEFYGLGRRDVYEIPVECIRELILNAVIHRSYLDHGNIQVAVYDDRLEVTSPGKLPMGQSIERMKSGYSIIRNEAIAHAFSYMKLMEHWGSGIPKVAERAAAIGLRTPEYLGGDVDLRVNLYRRGDVEVPNVVTEYGYNVENFIMKDGGHKSAEYNAGKMSVERTDSKRLTDETDSKYRQQKPTDKTDSKYRQQKPTDKTDSKNRQIEPTDKTDSKYRQQKPTAKTSRQIETILTRMEKEKLYRMDEISDILGLKRSRTRELVLSLVSEGKLIAIDMGRAIVYQNVNAR